MILEKTSVRQQSQNKYMWPIPNQSADFLIVMFKMSHIFFDLKYGGHVLGLDAQSLSICRGYIWQCSDARLRKTYPLLLLNLCQFFQNLLCYNLFLNQILLNSNIMIIFVINVMTSGKVADRNDFYQEQRKSRKSYIKKIKNIAIIFIYPLQMNFTKCMGEISSWEDTVQFFLFKRIIITYRNYCN